MILIASISPFWITLGPIVAINAVLFVSFMLFHLWGKKHIQCEFAGAKKGGSNFLSSDTREWWFWTTDPIVRLFVKLHMGPNTLTMIGFLMACVSAYLFSQGWFGYAGWAMIFGASFDMFDGRVARITGKSSRSGAFFDATMDRFGEGACLLGLAYYFRNTLMLPVVVAALIGSLLVSYTKARAEAIGVECNVGIMQRPERIVALGVAAAFDPIVRVLLARWWEIPPPLLVMISLGIIALMTNFTATYRMIYVMNALDTADKRGRDSIPQIITKLGTQAGRENLWNRAHYGYDRSRAEYSHVVLFTASGISYELTSELLRRGELPNIARYIAERGSVTSAVGAFPSTVGPASTTFVTGSFPGTCDIPGSRWFDRSVLPGRVLALNRFRDYLGWGAYAMDYDLAKSVRTIFEYSRQAVNIFGMLNRGCGLVRDPAFFGMHRRYNQAREPKDLEKADEAAFYWFSSAMRRETDFVLYRFPPTFVLSGDKRSTESAKDSLRHIDSYIGRAVKFIKDQGMYDQTVLMFAADHSVGEASRAFDLDDFLGKRFKICPPERRLKDWFDSTAIAMPSGTSMAHLYLKLGRAWENHAFFEDVERTGLIGALLEKEAIDIIAGRSSEGGILVLSRMGKAHILEDADGRITYIARSGDPFGFEKVQQVLSSKDALISTKDSEYPDAIMQILQIFRSRRAGDIVISSQHDTVLGKEIKSSTHGSLRRNHMIVPFVASVPIAEPVIRTADVFALTLSLLGIDQEHALDGTVPARNEIAAKKARATL